MVARLTPETDLRYLPFRPMSSPPAADPHDVALVRDLARGDNAALGALYDRYGGLLFAIGLRILGDHGEAEELLHEVFVEAWKQAPTYDPARGSVRAWLSTRMRSRCLDRCKSAGRARSIALDDAPEPRTDPSEDPALTRDRLRVRAALQTLSVDQREIIELGYFEGLTSSEMASRLGIPIGTVKSRAAAAMNRLRAALNGEAR